MATVNAHGMTVSPPAGWDVQIYSRELDPGVMTTFGVGEVVPPIAHIANFGLPPLRGDYGGGAVELMESGAIFIALLEHDAPEADTALFRGNGIPWPLDPEDFDPNNLQRGLEGQSGIQRFFVANGRPFCLYVVLGSHRQRAVLVNEVNSVLSAVTFD